MTSLLSASSLVSTLLDGPRRDLAVVDRSRFAWQLADPSGRVACALMTPDAVALPHGLVVDALPDASADIAIGDRALRVGNRSCQPHRWWRPARPMLNDVTVDPDAVDVLGRTWSDRLGLGPGLTPYHDDVLCGALVVLAATGSAAHLRATIAASDLERRTTATSAALIRLASHGWCVDAVAEHLVSLAGGVDDPQTRRRLLEVGSSSGLGLLTGIRTVLGSAAEAAA